MDFLEFVLIVVLLIRWIVLSRRFRSMEQRLEDESFASKRRISDLTARIYALENARLAGTPPPMPSPVAVPHVAAPPVARRSIVAHPTPATTPQGEASQAVEQALGSYFQTHPPAADRERQLVDAFARNRQSLAGKTVYRGVRNYRERIPRGAREFPGERRVY